MIYNRIGYPILAASVAIGAATTAYAQQPACSVDVAAPDGEQVSAYYIMVRDVRHTRLEWTLAPRNPSPILVRVGYSDIGGSSIDDAESIIILGGVSLVADTESKSAQVIGIFSDNSGFHAPAHLSKEPVGSSGHGVAIVNFNSFKHQPIGQRIMQAISARQQMAVVVQGDAGDVFSKDVYDFGDLKHRDDLVAQARKKLADLDAAGCRPIIPLPIPPIPRTAAPRP